MSNIDAVNRTFTCRRQLLPRGGTESIPTTVAAEIRGGGRGHAINASRRRAATLAREIDAIQCIASPSLLPAVRRWLYLLQIGAGARGWGVLVHDWLAMLDERYAIFKMPPDRTSAPPADWFALTRRGALDGLC